jgi:signal transduction histidine kinase
MVNPDTPQENIFDDLNRMIQYLIEGNMDSALDLAEKTGPALMDQPGGAGFAATLGKFISQYQDGAVFLNALTNGNLDILPPVDPLRENFMIAQYKQLHSNLNHLTWQMQQIVRGDFQQKVRFLGDFSVAFNNLIDSLREKKLMEDKINLQFEQLKNLNTEKDKFFSIIAHDLRNPFNAFLGFTELMVEELPSLAFDELQQMAVNMRNSAANLYRLLENLLEWSMLQRGLTDFNPVSFLLKPKILECLALVQEIARKKEIELGYDEAGETEVFADVHMFGAIIRNLTSNALKFTPKGGKITIAARPVPGGQVEISVRDTGIGMSSEMRDNLFRLDVQSSRRGTEDEPSTGLGLFLCKDFIEKHGGKIWVESEVGKGSVFYFSVGITTIS